MSANPNGLKAKKCKACEGDAKPLSVEEAKKYLPEVPQWSVSGDGKSIRREFKMKDFSAGAELINRIADVANDEDHHPDLHLTGYRNLAVELTTHAIDGLSENDFILAAKIDDLPREEKS